MSLTLLILYGFSVVCKIERETVRYQSSASLGSNIESKGSTTNSVPQAKVFLCSLAFINCVNVTVFKAKPQLKATEKKAPEGTRSISSFFSKKS
jgi:hypothetical protein